MTDAARPGPRTDYDSLAAQIAAAAAAGRADCTVGLLVIRIHNLRRVNATYGHRTGDQILAELGKRLRDVARRRDRICLIADDEYAMILTDLASAGHAELAANKIQRVMTQPFCVDTMLHDITATVGVGTCQRDPAGAAHLLQRAELALAAAEARSLPYAVYSDTAAHATAVAWDVEAELAEALENSDLELYYQPQVDLAGDQICGAEALMRWRHPLRGMLAPEAFIGAAERSGQIHELMWSALNMALQQAAQWPALTLPLHVGINISAAVFGDQEFAATLAGALALWRVPPQRVVLEITETALMQELDTRFAALKQLHDMGITISIDDFGTGYSSLAYFRNLPAREVKIDKCFIARMLDSTKDRDIVESIIGLARKFDLRVVAEGVTDATSMAALRELGCHRAQGYFLGEPMPHPTLLEFLDRHRAGWQAAPAP